MSLPAGTPISSKITINPVAQQYLNLIAKLPPPTDPVTDHCFTGNQHCGFPSEIMGCSAFSSKLSLYWLRTRQIPTTDVNSLFSSVGLPTVFRPARRIRRGGPVPSR
jgi:hypothetical protein